MNVINLIKRSLEGLGNWIKDLFTCKRCLILNSEISLLLSELTFSHERFDACNQERIEIQDKLFELLNPSSKVTVKMDPVGGYPNWRSTVRAKIRENKLKKEQNAGN